MTIKPVVGHIVWFWQSSAHEDREGIQPEAAVVTHVIDNTNVNLCVLSHIGDSYAIQSVPFVQEGFTRPDNDCYCTWMPFEAKKCVEEPKERFVTAREIENSPVKGYTDQTAQKVDLVNENKVLEESILRRLDELGDSGQLDHRWLLISKTHIEQGFMALNRAIFKPRRLEEDNDSYISPEKREAIVKEGFAEPDDNVTGD